MITISILPSDRFKYWGLFWPLAPLVIETLKPLSRPVILESSLRYLIDYKMASRITEIMVVALLLFHMIPWLNSPNVSMKE